jgi:hypothetical protein
MTSSPRKLTAGRPRRRDWWAPAVVLPVGSHVAAERPVLERERAEIEVAPAAIGMTATGFAEDAALLAARGTPMTLDATVQQRQTLCRLQRQLLAARTAVNRFGNLVNQAVAASHATDHRHGACFQQLHSGQPGRAPCVKAASNLAAAGSDPGTASAIGNGAIVIDLHGCISDGLGDYPSARPGHLQPSTQAATSDPDRADLG